MPKRIYVGNLPFSATDDEVREMFGAHGAVTSRAPPAPHPGFGSCAGSLE